MTLELKRRQFTIAQYHQMIETGVLHEGDRVELIEGEILEMAAMGSKHAAQVRRLNHLFSRRFGDDVWVSIQNPVELGPRSEPEPDVALLRWRKDCYETEHPQASDIYLVIEVADSTAEFDRKVKAPLYARSKVIEYWLIDLNAEAIAVYREPAPEGYRQVETMQRGQFICVMGLPNAEFTVDEILG
jgi:Uma2 family endonuclease